MNNKKLGTDFEKEVCQELARKGFWVHFITPDQRGSQPFDIIAVKDGLACAIECKTLADNKKYFSIDRLEDNQIMAFEKWLACGNLTPVIFVKHKNEVYKITWEELKEKKKVRLQDVE